MRFVDPELQARLEAGAATVCTCWTITQRDGTVLGFTDHDADIDLDGVVCAAKTALDTAAQEGNLGLAVDTTGVSGALSSGAITATLIDSGALDGAAVARWLVDWRQPTLRHRVFSGQLGDIAREGAVFRAEVLGLSAALNAPVGRVCQRLCDARLGDERCGVDLLAAAYHASATVLWVDERGLAVTGLGDAAAGWFSLGHVRWSHGGEDRIVGHWIEGGVHRLELARVIGSAGDSCTVFAGCDRSVETCAAKFGNTVNFRGFPFMPGEDWALAAAPAAGGVHDGGARR